MPLQFHAIKPNEHGNLTAGGSNQLLIKDLKTIPGAFRRARKVFGNTVRLFAFAGGDVPGKYNLCEWYEIDQLTQRLTRRTLRDAI